MAHLRFPPRDRAARQPGRRLPATLSLQPSESVWRYCTVLDLIIMRTGVLPWLVINGHVRYGGWGLDTDGCLEAINTNRDSPLSPLGADARSRVAGSGEGGRDGADEQMGRLPHSSSCLLRPASVGSLVRIITRVKVCISISCARCGGRSAIAPPAPLPDSCAYCGWILNRTAVGDSSQSSLRQRRTNHLLAVTTGRGRRSCLGVSPVLVDLPQQGSAGSARWCAAA